MRAIDIDTLEWFQIKCVGLDEPMILIRKPHILELDIIEAEPVRHGRWEDIGLGFMMLYACTHCGKQALFQNRPYPYCPNCGAKMDAKED